MTHPTDEIAGAMISASAKDRLEIREAYDFAEKAHGEEKRKSGDAYVTHPKSIALTLAKLGMDKDTIIAGILHDTVEDTPVTPDEIEKKFGATVRFLVDGVTKLSKLKYRGVERHVESLRRLLVATANDVRVIIIKLADRLHNMQTIQFVEPAEKRRRIALETMEVYVPVAERLGIGILKSQLEDLAFKTLEPERYRDVAQFLTEKEEAANEALDKTIKELRRALAENGIKKFHTETRIKNAHSFAKKLSRKDNDIDKIYDIFAVRVIVPSIEDCYRALGIVHALWKPIIGRVKDYIALPKANGYRTLHTTVITPHGITVEIQIRSDYMQRESKFGVASHFVYKDPKQRTNTVGWAWQFIPSLMKIAKGQSQKAPLDAPRWLEELNSAAAEFSEQKSFQEALKQDFFAERMFIYTPKGDVIDLPVGATAVDFAYAIHSGIGDTMMGAKVNGKMTSLDTPLHNGNIVEILTKKSARPHKKWLTYAKTSAAKHHIRSALSKQPVIK